MEALKDLDENPKRTDVHKKFITYEVAAERYQLCEATIRKMAKECNALYKIGRAVRIKVDVLDDYVETFRDET